MLNEILKMKNLNQWIETENSYRADYYKRHLQLKRLTLEKRSLTK